MVHIERTPLKKILRAVVYRNTKKLPLSEIVEREKPDLAMTGVFYSPAKWAPVCPVKADGTVLFADQQDSYWALGWDVGADVLPILVPPGGESDCRNYVANCLLVRAGRPQQKLYYNDDVGGRRGRVAVGLTKDTWITYGASDGSSGAMTPEDLRDYMVGQGCQFAVMMDGGGKVNLYVRSANVLIQGKDPSQNLILLYLDDGETEETPVSEKKAVVLDPGHDASNLANKSPDGTYYEHEFALDMGNRLKAILERHGVVQDRQQHPGAGPVRESAFQCGGGQRLVLRLRLERLCVRRDQRRLCRGAAHPGGGEGGGDRGAVLPHRGGPVPLRTERDGGAGGADRARLPHEPGGRREAAE